MLYRDLPDDMQVLLMQFLEDRGIEVESVDALLDTTMPSVDVAVSDLHMQAQQEPWDYRGPAHVELFRQCYVAGKRLAPIIVEGGRWIDGRHRILAAHAAGLNTLTAIDFNQWAQAFANASATPA